MGTMSAASPLRCPAFLAKDGHSTAPVAIHYGPCRFVHPYEEGWDDAGTPDDSMIAEYHREHPIRSAPRSLHQQLMDDIFGPDEDEDVDMDTSETRSTKLPRWEDLDVETVKGNLEAFNSAMAGIGYPTLEVRDSGVPGEGPLVSFSSDGGYTYPRELQYSRPHLQKQTFAQSWSEIEVNAKRQWDEAHGLAQTRAAGVVNGRLITRPVLNTGALPARPGPPSPTLPRSPIVDKRRRDEFGIKSEGWVEPGTKRPRRDGSPDLNPSLGEQLRTWRVVLQPMLKPERRQEASIEKWREISNIVRHLEDLKDDIPRDLLGRLGTKMGKVISKLGQVEDMPFEEKFHVKERSLNLTRYWNNLFGAEDEEAG